MDVPYNPRWLYRFFAAAERVPVPGWVRVLIVLAGGGVLLHLAAWQTGAVAAGQFNNYLAGISLILVIPPALWVYFTHRAQHALADFFAGSPKSAEQIEEALADFNSIPGWLVPVLLVAGVLWGYADYRIIFDQLFPQYGTLLPILNLFIWVGAHTFGLLMMGRTVRQVFIIQRLYEAAEVDLFNPIPLYALSRYTSQIGLMFVTLTYVFGLFVLPTIFFSPIGIAYQLLSVGIALLVFVAPLMGVNRRMRLAKDHILSELGADIRNVYAELHQAVQTKNYSAIGQLQPGVLSLKNELEMVQKIPTWPWQPETLRNLLTPMLIPVIVFIIQRFLGSALGF